MWHWLKNRWYEFRHGDGIYLRYGVSLIQFLILTYTLGIERWSWTEAIFSSITIFAATFFIVYVPLAILLGRFHRKKQLQREIEITIEQNPLAAYSNYVTMKQFSLFMEEKGCQISPEYIEMMEFWGEIAKDWKPRKLP